MAKSSQAGFEIPAIDIGTVIDPAIVTSARTAELEDNRHETAKRQAIFF